MDLFQQPQWLRGLRRLDTALESSDDVSTASVATRPATGARSGEEPDSGVSTASVATRPATAIKIAGRKTRVRFNSLSGYAACDRRASTASGKALPFQQPQWLRGLRQMSIAEELFALPVSTASVATRPATFRLGFDQAFVQGFNSLSGYAACDIMPFAVTTTTLVSTASVATRPATLRRLSGGLCGVFQQPQWLRGLRLAEATRFVGWLKFQQPQWLRGLRRHRSRSQHRRADAFQQPQWLRGLRLVKGGRVRTAKAVSTASVATRPATPAAFFPARSSAYTPCSGNPTKVAGREGEHSLAAGGKPTPTACFFCPRQPNACLNRWLFCGTF